MGSRTCLQTNDRAGTLVTPLEIRWQSTADRHRHRHCWLQGRSLPRQTGLAARCEVQHICQCLQHATCILHCLTSALNEGPVVCGVQPTARASDLFSLGHLVQLSTGSGMKCMQLHQDMRLSYETDAYLPLDLQKVIILVLGIKGDCRGLWLRTLRT